jgi:hypothetical protein
VDGAPYWQCSLCTPGQRKKYKVSAGTRAPANHLKEKHLVEEEINRKVQRLEAQKSNIEQAVESSQRVQKMKAGGEAPMSRSASGSGALEWNDETHKALLVRCLSSASGV